MDIIIFLAAAFAVLLSGAAAVLLRTERETVSKSLAEGDPPDTETAERVRNGAIKPFAAVMLAVNCALAVFQRLYYGDSMLQILNTLCLCTVLWMCTWCDVKAMLIPNRVLLIGLLARGLLLAAELLTAPETVLGNLLRCAAAALVLLVICLICRVLSPQSVGFGDVKLMMLMGFFLGVEKIWETMLVSMVAAFLYALFLLVAKHANRKTAFPFAPVLLAGTVLAAFLTNI